MPETERRIILDRERDRERNYNERKIKWRRIKKGNLEFEVPEICTNPMEKFRVPLGVQLQTTRSERERERETGGGGGLFFEDFSLNSVYVRNAICEKLNF